MRCRARDGPHGDEAGVSFPVICAVEICLRGANMGMAHESLNGPKVIPVVQKGRGERMPHDMGMDSLLDQSPLCRRLDEAVNCFTGQASPLVGTVFPQGLEEGMARLRPVTGNLDQPPSVVEQCRS